MTKFYITCNSHVVGYSLATHLIDSGYHIISFSKHLYESKMSLKLFSVFMISMKVQALLAQQPELEKAIDIILPMSLTDLTMILNKIHLYKLIYQNLLT